MKKTFSLVLILFVIMMISGKVQAAIMKTYGSPDGKKFITITYYVSSHDSQLIKLEVATNEGDYIFNQNVQIGSEKRPFRAVWSKKSDFAVIYFFTDSSKTSLLLYDLRVKDKSKRTTDLLAKSLKDLGAYYVYAQIVDMSKIKKLSKDCVESGSPGKRSVPSISITTSGDIKYYAWHSIERPDSAPPLKNEDVPFACRRKGFPTPIYLFVVEEIVQKTTGEVVSSKYYYSMMDTYPDL